jgi:hypothetical protein
MYLVKHFNHAGLTLGEVKPNSPSATVGLNTVESISYQIEIGHQLAVLAKSEPYVTDFVFYYKDLPLFGGLHTEVDINDVDEGYLNIAGKGWKHYFERRTWPPENTNPYTALTKDVFTIVRELLAAVDGLGLSLGSGTAGQTTDYKIDLGDTEAILSKIDALSKLQPGFDYEITWDKVLHLYAPKRGADVGYILEQGVNCGPISYRNPGIGGTALLGTGSNLEGGARASYFAKDNTAEAKYRRLDVTKVFGSIPSSNSYPPQLLIDMTTAELPRQVLPMRQLSIPWIGDDSIDNIFEEVWIGDTIRVKGDMEYEYIDDDYRVVGIEINPTDEYDDVIVFNFDDGTISL